jgi:hypothetical protein
MHILNQIINHILAKSIDEALSIHQVVFGASNPKEYFRGTGDTLQKR